MTEFSGYVKIDPAGKYTVIDGQYGNDEIKEIYETATGTKMIALSPAEIECLEVFADGSVELLGDHSRSVMVKMMLDIAGRAMA